MKSLDYVKKHLFEFEEDDIFDRRFTQRFLMFIPTSEWDNYRFSYTGTEPFEPKEWTEENILKQLKRDVFFGLEKAEDERGISAELMAYVVRGWCKVLENGCALPAFNDGYYHINQFKTVIDHYGWDKPDDDE